MNRLAGEKSPYLLQHAENPVNWFPWGEEAFSKAREEDKPVFLSIGYATCHWCHVMAHESFENEEGAALLNNAFICIKVDREERPDIDEIYMTVCQMLTQSGGWPLNIVMTPDKKPFFAATYIPLESRFGRLGLLELVPRISDAWKNQRTEIISSAGEITALLAEPEETGDALDAQLLTRVFQESEQTFDSEYGGFGAAPKFPSPHRLIFLIRQNPDAACPMVEKTLTAMRCGGIWDHIGSGVHRYATDREWLVPHFEKMLYDQAMTALACIEAFEAYGEGFYRRMAEEIFDYVLRGMTSNEGGLYSAEDADSEGVEGKFYVWSLNELKAALSPDELAPAIRAFNVQPDGNFRDESAGRKTGANILHCNPPRPAATPPAEGSKESPYTIPSLGGVPERRGGLSISAPKTDVALESIRKKLFAAREQRIHPLKDTKVLADWNGLMIAALAKASRIFHAPEYETAARRAADFIWNQMQNDGRLMHRWRDGETAVPGQLADYAFMIFGLLELYETAFDFQTLEKALALSETVLAHFQDKVRGGFYQTADDAEELIVRPKSMQDGAIPSGSSVQMMNLLKIARLTGRTNCEALADRTVRAFASTINRVPSAFAQAMQAVQFAQGEPYEVVIVGDRKAPETQALIEAVRSVYRPHKTVLLKEPGVEKIAPFTAEMNQPAVYICRNFACTQPLTDPAEVARLLVRE